MVYVLPQVQVFQDFNLAADVEVRDLPTFIAGGHAELFRYSEADEKALIGLGEYDNVGTNIDGVFKTCYSWPEKETSSLIDTGYTKLFIDNALLRYYRDTSDTIVKTDKNKLRHPTKNFKANGTTYPRAADFLDRDVAVGDTVSVIGSSDGGTTLFNLNTTVQDIEADQSAAVTGSATADSSNPTSKTQATTSTANTANTGTVAAPTVTPTAYDGLPDGDLTETYTITVTQASTGGDHTTARIRAVSGSGRDDDLEITPAAAASPTTIGARGLTVTFAAGNFAVGDEYTVTVTQNHVPATVTSGGTYTGTSDKTYIIEVTRGGELDSGTLPQITVITADGTDASGPHTVTPLTDSGTTTSTTTVDPGDLEEFDSQTIAIGTLGVTIQFQAYGLRKGDKWTIAATAAADTNFRTLVLSHDLDDLIPEDDAVNAAIELRLYIKTNLELGERHEVTDGAYNFDQTNTQFCARAGIQAYDSTWTDSGVQQALDVITDAIVTGSNQMYVEFRAWDQSLIGEVQTITAEENLDTVVSGPTTPDNPLKFGLFMARQNSNNQDIKFIAISDPDVLADWNTALDKTDEREDIYNMVPLTHDATVHAAFLAQVNSQSTETAGRWRVMWVGLEDSLTTEIVNETLNSGVVLATTEDDPNTTGTQYTILKGPSGDGDFANVQAGDIVRYLYTTNLYGDDLFTEFTVAEVINNDTLRLATDPGEENTPRKVEVYRNNTVAARATAIATAAGVWNNRRVRAIWPDKFDGSGFTDVDNMFLCAALASLSSGVLPHQGLTNVTVTGVTAVDNTVKLFNRAQLDEIAGSGGWIVTQTDSGAIISRHAVTTADTDTINLREEQITRNVDSISFYFLDTFAPYIGRANATPKMLEVIESETLAAIQFLRRSGETQLLGGQLIDAEITELRRSLTLKDRFILGLTLEIPAPLNVIEVHLLIP
jgi:hypothetical protein